MNNAILLCLIVGIAWSSTPLLARLSSVNAMMMTILIASGTLVATLPVMFSQNYAAAGSKALAIGLIAGVVNGIGLIAFYRLVAGSNEGLWESSKVLPLSLILMLVGIAFGSRIFFGEAITPQKLIGVSLACGAIWFLR